MTRNEIQSEFDKFFAFPSEDRSNVSTVSALLFAEHIAQLERSNAPAWHDAPDAPGLWVSIEPNGAYDTHKVLAPVDFYIDSSWIDGSRYFGPIPSEDKP